MTTPTIAEVAGKLSDAQREFIPTITIDDWWRTDEETPRGIVGPLTKAGILDVQRFSDMGNVYCLTDLGCRLREYLSQQGRSK